jgi:predicted enzyme related to lactoylglutathione lyase
MPNPVVHFEIGCRDHEKTVEFYKQLFEWQMSPGEISTEIATGADEPVTGHIVSLGHEPHTYTNFYVQVPDASKALEKAVSLGGKIVIPPIPIPDGSGSLFAWFADPEGNTVGIIQRKA